MNTTHQDHNPTPSSNVAYPPVHNLEALLAIRWNEVLGLENLGPEEDFFDLGGNSLTVVELRRLLAADGIHLAMPDVYRHPNLRALAKFLTS